MSCFAWLTVCLAAPGQAVLHPASCSGGLPAPRLCCLSLSPSMAPVLPASTCRAESWQTHTDGLLWHMLNSSRGCLRFSHCLCCWGFFFFYFGFCFVLLSLHTFVLPVSQGVECQNLNVKENCVMWLGCSRDFPGRFYHAEFYCKLEAALNSFERL